MNAFIVGAFLWGSMTPATQLQDEESDRRIVARAHLVQIAAAVKLFHALNARFPAALADLIRRPEGIARWPEGGFLLGGTIPSDPWGRAYSYSAQEDGFALKSLGADGREGGTGENRDLDASQAGVPPVNEIAANEKQARNSIAIFGIAEMDFMSNDRDGNGVMDYWTGDVSGFHRIQAKGESINLITLELAKADGAPLLAGGLLGKPVAEEPVPHHGYLFRVLKRDKTGGAKPFEYQDGTGKDGRKVFNRDRFGFAAYPSEYGKTGIITLIVNQEAVIYWKDLKGAVIEEFPDAPLSQGWKKAK